MAWLGRRIVTVILHCLRQRLACNLGQGFRTPEDYGQPGKTGNMGMKLIRPSIGFALRR
jgi:hypothetical protein